MVIQLMAFNHVGPLYEIIFLATLLWVAICEVRTIRCE
jgi:hypothetical protein